MAPFMGAMRPTPEMGANINFRLKMYKPTRTALSWFVLFAFAMGAYAYWKDIGSASQVIQALGFGFMALLVRLTLFRQPTIDPIQPAESGTDHTRGQ
jgi:hypothetical protein